MGRQPGEPTLHKIPYLVPLYGQRRSVERQPFALRGGSQRSRIHFITLSFYIYHHVRIDLALLPLDQEPLMPSFALARTTQLSPAGMVLM